MRILYDFSLWAYGLFFQLAQCFHPKAKRWVEGRKSWRKKLAHLGETEIDLWMHCASLGEFDQGLPVLWAFKAKHPTANVLVTFFSPSGMEHYHKRKHCVDFVAYLPLDTRKNARDFITLVKPKKALFVKYEFWLNYIFELNFAKISLFSVSTLLRPKQVFFRWYGGLFRKALETFGFFFVQNEETLTLLKSIGITNATVSGDTRYDAVLKNKNDQTQEGMDSALSLLFSICENQKILILGSSWEPEEELIYNQQPLLSFDKIIIAPHDISEKHFYSLEALFGDRSIRFSELSRYQNEKIILIDNIGYLNKIYALGSIALIGGGFSGKLHNILEPAAYGVPVLFGPKFKKFPEAQLFIDNGIGFSITDGKSLVEKISSIDKDREGISGKIQQFVGSQQGAAQKIIEKIS
jgi:3-deoxy-D-manno-octulosonic-acid transferase